MGKLSKAVFIVEDAQPPNNVVPVQYNPASLNLDKAVTHADITIPGLNSPLTQFVHGASEKLTVTLFFDTTDKGMGDIVVPVTTETDRIYALANVDSDKHAPPICRFHWSDHFAGAHVGTVQGSRRDGFRCVVENIKQEFTLFSPGGVPLRATVTVVLREYRPLHEQVVKANPRSPDRTHVRVLARGDQLAGLAYEHYRDAGAWRAIALKNHIEDPRRLQPGTAVIVPAIT
jgi:hypothetical protein